MLAVSSLRNTKDENQGEMERFPISSNDFPDFSDGNLLEGIDFDDLFIGMDDGDVLPDLEMDPEILAEFSVSGGDEYSCVNTSVSFEKIEDSSSRKDEEDKVSDSDLGSSSSGGDHEIMSKKDECLVVKPLIKEGDKGKKSSAQSKNSHGKRKVKVDWTPELHRRFVQAVEQLGVDKAVPSRILELMGIDCLTRYNIASHLQKYRSHRKHLLAREAEAASWTQRRQMYAAATGVKREMVPWVAPTMGFPPPMAPMAPMNHHFRPLHVWGHPSVDQSVMHMWPKHLPHTPSPPPPPPSWPRTQAPPQPPLMAEHSFWPPHHRVPKALTQGTPFFPQALPSMRFTAPVPVPGMPPHSMYKVDQARGQLGPPHPDFDFQPSKESIDAAIGDILSKPWQPLPLGLKPPALDSVMVELQRQGIPKIPPTCTA